MPPKRKAAEPATERTTKTRRAAAKPTKPAPATRKAAKENTKATAVPSGLDPATFTLERVQAMFDKYLDEDDNNIIGGKFQDMCLGRSYAYFVHSRRDGAAMYRCIYTDGRSFTSLNRLVHSFGRLKIDTPQKMALMASDLNSLFFGCTITEQASRMSIANNGHGVDAYDHTQLRSYQRNAESTYSKFYSFCFVLVKPPQSRNIDMETATAFWSVILVPKYPIAGELLEFIAEKGTYKAVTKDLWGMTLEFCKTVQPDLSGYDEEEAAWPTLLDDFVDQFGLPTHHGSNNSRPSYSSYSAWLHLPRGVTSIGPRSLLRFNAQTAAIGLGSESQELLIGGSWKRNLIRLGLADFNLSSTVTFASASQITMLPTDGYLNSRIDLRRRRRAFTTTSHDIVPPSIKLQLREDAVIQTRSIDPSTLREEFEKALVQNRRLKESLAARRSRKGKKNKENKVNSTG
ncbi:unnamed protein product [Rhizoctonia solani]|uniref:Defective in cullin neddylation protein n=1 Tax=Rhizoctonia solani TaxID=456999 RepID=A0A8H3E5C1_9AGAM|nr:unnamed protein product [Rhizoctonia solani]